jgi:hypothetical protein
MALPRGARVVVGSTNAAKIKGAVDRPGAGAEGWTVNVCDEADVGAFLGKERALARVQTADLSPQHAQRANAIAPAFKAWSRKTNGMHDSLRHWFGLRICGSPATLWNQTAP